MDIRRDTVGKLVAHVLKGNYRNSIAMAEQILIAAQETESVTKYQANQISERNGLTLRWEVDPSETPLPQWDGVAPTDLERQTAETAVCAFRESRYVGALEAVRKYRQWPLSHTKQWVDRVFPTMRGAC